MAGTRVDELLAQAEAEWRSGEITLALGRYDSALEIVRAEPALAEREGVICLGKGFALMHDAGAHGSDGSMRVDRALEDEKRWAEVLECLLRAQCLADAESGHQGGAQAAFIGPMLEEARRRHEAVKERLRGGTKAENKPELGAGAKPEMDTAVMCKAKADVEAGTPEAASNGAVVAREGRSPTADADVAAHAGADAGARAGDDANVDTGTFGSRAAEAVMRRALAMAVTRRAPVVAIVAVTAVTSVETEQRQNETDKTQTQDSPLHEHNKLTLAPSSLRLVRHLRAGGIRFDAFNAADGGMDVAFTALAATRERWWQKAISAPEPAPQQEPGLGPSMNGGGEESVAQKLAASDPSALPQLWVGGSLLLAGSRGAVQFFGAVSGTANDVDTSATVDADSNPARVLVTRALAELTLAEMDLEEENRPADIASASGPGKSASSSATSTSAHDPSDTLRTVFPGEVLAAVFDDRKSAQSTVKQTSSRVQNISANASNDIDESSDMTSTAVPAAPPTAPAAGSHDSHDSHDSHTAEIEGVVRDVLQREAAVALATLLDAPELESDPSDPFADLDSSLAFSQCISSSLSSTMPVLQCMQQDVERLLMAAGTAADGAQCSGATALPSTVPAVLGSFEAGFVRELSARLGGFDLPARLLQGHPSEENGTRHVETQNQTPRKGPADDASDVRRSIDDVVSYIEQHCPADGICGACPSRHTCSVHSGDASDHGGSCRGKSSQVNQSARGWIDVADIEGLGIE